MKNKKFSLKKIEALKIRMQNLPLKDDMKNREETIRILYSSFNQALKKGYSLKELRALFVEEGIHIPLYLFKKQSEDR